MMWFSGRTIARCAVALVALTVMSQPPATPAQAQQAAVAGDPITDSEIEQRARLWANIPGKPYTHEQVVAELRDEKRKIREARDAGFEVLAAEVDVEYARMARRMGLSGSDMTDNLAEEGVGPETIKHRLHAELAWWRYQKDRSQP